jgi:hypothetical protein
MVEDERRRPTAAPLPIIAESQLSELRNMRVLLEEARVRTRNLAYHRRARLEGVIGDALEELERQIEELRAEQQQGKEPSRERRAQRQWPRER